MFTLLCGRLNRKPKKTEVSHQKFKNVSTTIDKHKTKLELDHPKIYHSSFHALLKLIYSIKLFSEFGCWRLIVLPDSDIFKSTITGRKNRKFNNEYTSLRLRNLKQSGEES